MPFACILSHYKLVKPLAILDDDCGWVVRGGLIKELRGIYQITLECAHTGPEVLRQAR